MPLEIGLTATLVRRLIFEERHHAQNLESQAENNPPT